MKKLSICVVILLLAGGGIWWWQHSSAQESPKANTTSQQPKTTKKPAPKPTEEAFNKSQYSLTDSTSLWVVVNKARPLSPKEYVPANLVVPNLPMRVAGTQLAEPAANAMVQLFAAAQAAGTPLKISSGYRSYTYQVNLYNGYVKTEGQAQADQESARPGYSEHQTGLAADLMSADTSSCAVAQCWAQTPESKWLAANAYKYGFIIRYTDGFTNVTGYEYEPWHVRYVGVALATEMHKQNSQTLEQFFDLPNAPDYPAR